MKANIKYTNKKKVNKMKIGSVYQSQDKDMTYILLKLVSAKDSYTLTDDALGLTYEVLSVDPDGVVTTFNLQAHEIASVLEYVGVVDELNINIKAV